MHVGKSDGSFRHALYKQPLGSTVDSMAQVRQIIAELMPQRADRSPNKEQWAELRHLLMLPKQAQGGKQDEQAR